MPTYNDSTKLSSGAYRPFVGWALAHQGKYKHKTTAQMPTYKKIDGFLVNIKLMYLLMAH